MKIKVHAVLITNLQAHHTCQHHQEPLRKMKSQVDAVVTINLLAHQGGQRHQELLHSNNRVLFQVLLFHNPSTPSFKVPNAQIPSVPGFFPSVGGRPPYPHAVESQTNTLRRIIRSMEALMNDLRANNRLLQGLLNSQLTESSTPDVAKWELMKPHMKRIAQKSMLGLDVTRNRCCMVGVLMVKHLPKQYKYFWNVLIPLRMEFLDVI